MEPNNDIFQHIKKVDAPDFLWEAINHKINAYPKENFSNKTTRKLILAGVMLILLNSLLVGQYIHSSRESNRESIINKLHLIDDESLYK